MIASEFHLSFSACRTLLLERLAEPAPGRIQLLSGPRQVGKTTLLLELQAAIGERAIYAAADGPEAGVPGFWERLWSRAEQQAASNGPVVLLLDELHVLPQWAARLKGEWDRLRRRHIPVNIVATGSSAMHLGLGSRESLAGRFERLTLAHWSASAIADGFGIAREAAADVAVRCGTYPGATALRDTPDRWAAYVRDAIIEPAIGRDVLALAAVRRPALLRQVFGVCVSSPAQIVSLQKIQGQMQDAGALATIAHYLALLEEAYLVAALPKYSLRDTRRRAAPPKLVTLNNALLSGSHERGAPDRDTDPARFGAWVENACLAHAWNAGQHVSYWREEPLEVDAVLRGSWGDWAIEVKTGAVESSDLRGVLEFTRRHPAFRPLLVCEEAGTVVAARAGVASMSWHAFLLGGPHTG